MILLKPSVEIVDQIDARQMLAVIEKAARICYKSGGRMGASPNHAFIRNVIERQHLSVTEHRVITVVVRCDRGVSHEIVRHRIGSYSQESTRYCNYKGGVEFIIPPWVDIKPGKYVHNLAHGRARYLSDIEGPDDLLHASNVDLIWLWHCLGAERDYKILLANGWKPQQARSVLPNSLKTEIMITFNLREWRHFFKLRALGTTGAPHPQIKEIAVPLLQAFKLKFPVIFDDLEISQ